MTPRPPVFTEDVSLGDDDDLVPAGAGAAEEPPNAEGLDAEESALLDAADR